MKKHIVFHLDNESKKNMNGAFLTYEMKNDGELIFSGDTESLKQLGEKLLHMAEEGAKEMTMTVDVDTTKEKEYKESKEKEGRLFLENQRHHSRHIGYHGAFRRRKNVQPHCHQTPQR